ncbi:hypothetical protein LCGC14_2405790, partial [marine sediment metagenome]
GGGTVKKAADPKPMKPKDTGPYTDPHNRWVPWDDPSSPEAKKWLDNIYEEGEKFSDASGLGPCAPVADNIVEVLQAEGRSSRVMYTHYTPIGPAGELYPGQAFPHYVAVELDEHGRVFRIWDPTNPHRNARGIREIKPGQALPEEYFSKGSWARKPANEITLALDDIEQVAFFADVADPKLLTVAMRNVQDTPAQFRRYYELPDGNMKHLTAGTAQTRGTLKTGIGYDLDDELITVRSMAEQSPGAANQVLRDMAQEASDSGRALLIHADDIPTTLSDDGATYLADKGFVRDTARGEGWYLAEGKSVRTAQYRFDEDLNKMLPDPGDMRDRTEIFTKGSWARDDGSVYSMENHQWWYGKLTKSEAQAVAAEAGALPVYEWTYMGRGKEAQKQFEGLFDVVNEGSYYPQRDGYGLWRYSHAKDFDVPKWADAATLDEVLHGKVYLSKWAETSTINGWGNRLAQLQTRTHRLGIPPLRGFNATAKVRTSIGGSMGDGVLTMNPSTATRVFGKATFDVVKYKVEVQRFIDDAKPLL